MAPTPAGARTGYYIYDVWDPQLGLGSDAHTVLPNDTRGRYLLQRPTAAADGNIEMWGGDITNLATGRALLPAQRRQQPVQSARQQPGAHRQDVPQALVCDRDDAAQWRGLHPGRLRRQCGTGGKDFPKCAPAPAQFRLLTGASTYYLDALYPRNFVAPDGKVFGTALHPDVPGRSRRHGHAHHASASSPRPTSAPVRPR